MQQQKHVGTKRVSTTYKQSVFFSSAAMLSTRPFFLFPTHSLWVALLSVWFIIWRRLCKVKCSVGRDTLQRSRLWEQVLCVPAQLIQTPNSLDVTDNS